MAVFVECETEYVGLIGKAKGTDQRSYSRLKEVLVCWLIKLISQLCDKISDNLMLREYSLKYLDRPRILTVSSSVSFHEKLWYLFFLFENYTDNNANIFVTKFFSSSYTKNCFFMRTSNLIAELAERSPIITQNSANSSSRKNLDVRPYDRTTDRTTFSMKANCTTVTIL